MGGGGGVLKYIWRSWATDSCGCGGDTTGAGEETTDTETSGGEDVSSGAGTSPSRSMSSSSLG